MCRTLAVVRHTTDQHMTRTAYGNDQLSNYVSNNTISSPIKTIVITSRRGEQLRKNPIKYIKHKLLLLFIIKQNHHYCVTRYRTHIKTDVDVF